MNAPSTIPQIDNTVIYTGDMPAMRHFYGAMLGFKPLRELSSRWVEYAAGAGRAGLLRVGAAMAVLDTVVSPALANLQPRRPGLHAALTVASCSSSSRCGLRASSHYSRARRVPLAADGRVCRRGEALAHAGQARSEDPDSPAVAHVVGQ